jgi:hypothetical protein
MRSKYMFPHLAGGKNNITGLFQFQKEAAAEHVIVLHQGALPTPKLTKSQREFWK